MKKFATVEEARVEIVKRLMEKDDWKDAFLMKEDGEIIGFYLEKEIAKSFSSITPIGAFASEKDMYKFLKSAILANASVIADWLVNGDNTPLKMVVVFKIPAGCSFDLDGNEYVENKLQMCIRRDRTNTMEYGFFVSTFFPIHDVKKSCGVKV